MSLGIRHWVGLDDTIGGMCGRFELSETPLRLVAERMGIEVDPRLRGLDRKRFNIAPGQRVACTVRGRRATASTSRDPQLREALWGLSGTDGGQRINARVETLGSVWLNSPTRVRGLIPADGFIEWNRQAGRRREPFHLRLDRGMLWLAAVIELDGSVASSDVRGVVVTCEAAGQVARLHGRMPLMFGAWEGARRWMEQGRYEGEALMRLSSDLKVARISTRINSASHDDPGCLAPAEVSSQLSLFGTPAEDESEL